MQIKRFEAQDMSEALRLIKQEFGPEAVILSVRSLKKEKGIFGFLKRSGVEVTAAIDRPYQEAKKTSSSSKIGNFYEKNQSGRFAHRGSGGEKGSINLLRTEIKTLERRASSMVRRNLFPQNDTGELFALHQQLLAQGVRVDSALELMEEVNKTVSSKRLLKSEEIKRCLIRILEERGVTVSPIKMEHGKQKIVAFIGPTGVGKTISIAKLAADHALQKKTRVALITLDNYRIAAIRQLEVYARIIGIPLDVASNNKELKKSLERLRDKDLILIDTAGISQSNEYQLKELKGFFHKIPAVETHLVLSATTKEKDLMDILERFREIPVHRLLFTKLDETTTYGAILNLVLRTKIPLSYFTNGQQVPEDIETASLKRLVDLIIDQKKETSALSGLLGTLKDEDKGPCIPRNHHMGYYIANKNSDVFHCPDCKRAKKIKTDNVIVFESMLEAVNRNFTPCKLCRPDRVEEYDLIPYAPHERKRSRYQ